jgi:hypothetical protein
MSPNVFMFFGVQGVSPWRTIPNGNVEVRIEHQKIFSLSRHNHPVPKTFNQTKTRVLI